MTMGLLTPIFVIWMIWITNSDKGDAGADVDADAKDFVD